MFIFEFSHFYPKDFNHGREFVEMLDQFFGQLPRGYSYAVEIRNKSLLQPEYFSMLASHGVAHLFNSWTKMPEMGEQMAMPGSFTADFSVARLLLRPGRTYEEAVSSFSPYTALQDPNAGVREAAKRLIEKVKGTDKPSFVFVNMNDPSWHHYQTIGFPMSDQSCQPP
ncbi:hypothetical protein BGE01nite_31710 [Brevifollis gellanilyticus]|uniref:Uncharacterized protein n=1 Tax=Brevifollis gellanilyticus TaxID=748831 RepID=A0A512MAX5_9BACT|nr:hypothetical protein BGE01nite_31710 [Brevifollis gellanilyticus]